MPLDTYQALQDEIAAWVGDSSDPNFRNAIRTAIHLCEADLSLRAKLPEMIKRSFFLLNEEYENLPPDFGAMKAVYVTRAGMPSYAIGAVSEERIEANDYRAGIPRAYALVGMQIRLSPRPMPIDPNMGVKLIYYRRLPPLSDATVCTVVLQRYPQLYLSGGLAWMEGYLVNDERVAGWKAQYEQTLMAGNDAAVWRTGSRAAA